MIDFTAIILWALGGLLVLCLFEPAEESKGFGLLFMALAWPIATIWIAINELFFPDPED